jgi:tetratricopeptide (TPR) repeat protein
MAGKSASLLRGVCLLGLIVSLVLAGALFLLSRLGGVPIFPSGLRRGSFVQALEEYDAKITENPELPSRQRNALLDSLEKKALDTENTLSVLKRRRLPALRAQTDREVYLAAYVEAAGRAGKAYPFSAQVGALRAEALILEHSAGGPLSPEAAAEIRDLASLMSQGALQDLSLAFSVYSGAMGDPAAARLLPRELFTLLCSLAQGTEREKYLVNSCIRTLLEGETNEAIAMVNAIFDSGETVSPQTSLFGGEFFYDHGNYYKAAELFSVFTDDRFLARQGDALWLGNFVDQARGLWRIAASGGSGGQLGQAPGERIEPEGAKSEASPAEEPGAVKARSLYNLASSSPDAQEEGRWLELLFAANAEYPPGRIFGIIRYSRLAPADRALAILEQTDQDEGLFALELLRRKSEEWTVDRTVAETWLLLNTHNNDGRLFEWAVWYFDFQRRYEETALALRNAGINRVEGPWSGLHRAFAQVREGHLEEAEKTLRSIVRSPGERAGRAPGRRQQPLWQASADLGLILDIRNMPREALEYYETAAGQLFAGGRLFPESADAGGAENVPNAETARGIPAAGTSPERRDAARVQIRIAGALRTLGREEESRRALDYALDLDPENLEARLEKRRLDNSRGVL